MPVYRSTRNPSLDTHENNTAQGSEVSSANYEARQYGVRAGMFMAQAKRCCPHMLVLPYEVPLKL